MLFIGLFATYPLAIQIKRIITMEGKKGSKGSTASNPFYNIER